MNEEDLADHNQRKTVSATNVEKGFRYDKILSLLMF